MVFDHDEDKPVDETTWPRVWQSRNRCIYNQKREEHALDVGMRAQLIELLRAAETVSPDSYLFNFFNNLIIVNLKARSIILEL